MRILPAAIVLVLGGCSVSEVALAPHNDSMAGPQPPYRKLISGGLNGILGDAKQAKGLQISDLRMVNSIKGAAWLTCLKADINGRSQFFAVFLQEQRIVDSRIAVGTDLCEMQAYQPFGVFTDSQSAIR